MATPLGAEGLHGCTAGKSHLFQTLKDTLESSYNKIREQFLSKTPFATEGNEKGAGNAQTTHLRHTLGRPGLWTVDYQTGTPVIKRHHLLELCSGFFSAHSRNANFEATPAHKNCKLTENGKQQEKCKEEVNPQRQVKRSPAVKLEKGGSGTNSISKRRRSLRNVGGYLMVSMMLVTPTCQVNLWCPKGYLLYTPREGPDICLKCFPGTFMPLRLHKHRQCFECTNIQNPNVEIVVSACNRFNDTGIHCIDGYYRTKPSYPVDRGLCQKCTRCPFPKRPCQKFSDTVCCPNEHFDVFVNKHGKPECVPLCGRGQFLDQGTKQCLPCHQNTYMHVERHTHIYCKNCEVPRSKQEVMIQPCNSTHPAIIGCIDGYYRRPSLIYPFHRCAKCQDCSEKKHGPMYVGRTCNQFNDTVCCSQPNMIVVDAPTGPQCILPTTPVPLTSTDPADTQNQMIVYVTFCGKGQFLTFDLDQSSTACEPCPNGTCMDETSHTRTVCHSCVPSAHYTAIPQLMDSSGGKQIQQDKLVFVMSITIFCFSLASAPFALF